MEHSRPDPVGVLALALLLVLALATRIAGLGHEPLWTDEAYSAWAAGLPLSTLLGAPFDTHLQLFYLLQRPLIAGLDSPELAARLPSALAGLLLPFVVWRMLRPLGRFPALAGALAMALQPGSIRYAQEARVYALLELLVALAALCLLTGLRAQRASPDRTPWRLWLAYAAVAIAAFHMQVVGAVFLAVLSLAGTCLLWRAPGPRAAWRFGVVHAPVVLACLPWLLHTLQAAVDPESFVWARHPDAVEALARWARATTAPQLWPAPGILAVFMLLLAAGGAWRLARAGHDDFLAVGLALALAPVLLWCIGFFKPVFMPRTVLPAVVGNVLLWAGWAVSLGDRSGRRMPWGAALVALLVPLLMARSLWASRGEDMRGDERALMRAVAAERRSGDRVVVNQPFAWFVPARYLPGLDAVTVVMPARGLQIDTDARRLSDWFSLPLSTRPAMDEATLLARLQTPTSGAGTGRTWWLQRGDDWRAFHAHLSACLDDARVERVLRRPGEFQALLVTGTPRACGPHLTLAGRHLPK